MHVRISVWTRFALVLLTVFAIGQVATAAGPGTWNSAGSLATARSAHTATLLPSGKLLVVGGLDSGVSFALAELYDPDSGIWRDVASMTTARYSHTATRLPSGKVLVIGGRDSSGSLASAELYDPASDSWSTAASLANARQGHTATLLPSGKVLVIGGADGSGSLASAELYDPASNSWSTAASLVSARIQHTTILLASGKVLAVGGWGYGGYLASSELYDPISDSWSAATSLAHARYAHTATLLPSGQVLMVGGLGIGGDLASAELYDPDGDSWRAAAPLVAGRAGASATLLPSGQLLVVGGYSYHSAEHLASAELYDPVSDSWGAAASLANARQGHTATLLPSGQVLMVGGHNGNSLASTERYEPATMTWSTSGVLGTARSYHTATLLPSGQVLVAGGIGSTGYRGSTELYDPSSHNWSQAGALVIARAGHTATLLPSGQVLVVGGNGNTGILAGTELYDPAENTWSAAGALGTGRRDHTATLLSSGQVLVTGGYNSTSGYLASTELYDPMSNTWSAAGVLPSSRQGHTATLLPSGQVLVVGGANSTGAPTVSAALYDPASKTWSVAGALGTARNQTTATLLPSGQVLVAGGYNGGNLASAERYDPMSNTWSAAGALGTARSNHTTTLLPSGQVLVVGGYNGNIGVLASAELYDPASNSWSAAGALVSARWHHTTTLLLSGEVLMAGGVNSSTLASTELTDPGLSPDPLRRPSLTTASGFLSANSGLEASSPGSSTDASGATLVTGFMPHLEAGSGGYNSSPSNAPVFQIQRIDNEQMRFIPNDGSVDVTDTTFTGSSTALGGFPAGPVLVRAWVNGVPSAALSSVVIVTPLAPMAPTATGGVGQASVAFTAPLSDGGAPISLYTATANPGGATATCNAPCSTISFDPLGAGSYTFIIVATNVAGNGPASVPSNAVIVQAASTTALTSSLNPSKFGQSVSFTATVTGQIPTGTVQFMDGATVLCSTVTLSSGTASCSTSTLAIGTHAITADYSGDINNNASSAGPLSQVVALTLTVTVTGSGTVSAAATPAPASGSIVACDSNGGSNCVASYAQNDIVTLVAMPAAGHHVTFAGDCASDGSVTMDVDRNCYAAFAPNTHAISGSLVGLVGSGLTLHLDFGSGSQDIAPVSGDTAFAFAPDVPYGASYVVSVSAQPGSPSQTCSVANASGTMPDSDVSNPSVTCVTNTHTVGGSVMGLTNTGLVLQLNGGNNLPVSADGNFTFATALPSGGSYLVTINAQPTNQFCALANASGTVTDADITDVTVDCVGMQAQLTLIIDDGSAYARYGHTINYLITLSNSGNTTINNIDLSSVLSAGLDSPFAQWQCFGAGSGATCSANGTGVFADTVTLPAGRSLSWVVSVPVRIDTSENTVTMEVSATGAVSVSDIDTLVILRDGFDVPYGSGSEILVPASASAAILRGELNLPFPLPPITNERIDIVMQLRSGDIEIAIERLVFSKDHYIRIVQHPQSGKDRISAWIPVASDATLFVASIATVDNQRILLLEGAAQSIDWPLTH